jgi:hypothetical protein
MQMGYSDKNQIQTLDEAIEAGLSISAVYAPNGEFVECWNLEDLREVEFQDGTMEKVDRNDLIDFTWK